MPTLFIQSTDMGMVEGESTTYATARETANEVRLPSFFMFIGQSVNAFGTYTCNESFLYFPLTDDLLGSVVIDSVTLVLDSAGDNSLTDFTVELREHSWSPTVQLADWVPGSQLDDKDLIDSWPSSSGPDMALESDALKTLVKANIGRSVEFILCSDRHRLGTVPTQNEYVTFHPTGSSGSPPRLNVEYTVRPDPAELYIPRKSYRMSGWKR